MSWWMSFWEPYAQDFALNVDTNLVDVDDVAHLYKD